MYSGTNCDVTDGDSSDEVHDDDGNEDHEEGSDETLQGVDPVPPAVLVLVPVHIANHQVQTFEQRAQRFLHTTNRGGENVF